MIAASLVSGPCKHHIYTFLAFVSMTESVYVCVCVFVSLCTWKYKFLCAADDVLVLNMSYPMMA